MFVDDHNLCRGGHPDAFAIVMLPAELELLAAGHMLTCANLYGRGTRFLVMAHDDIDRAADSNSPFVWVKLSRASLESAREGRVITINAQSKSVSRVMIRVSEDARPTSSS